MAVIGNKIKQYRITDCLGTGGMGEVYLAYDELLERKVAIKSMKKEIFSNETKARFLREARILSQLSHPNICTVYDFIEEKEENFLVIELVSGITLKEAIKKGLSFTRKIEIAIQICDVLSKAHSKNIVHRDLKPENIMINEEENVKVLDFGLAGISIDMETSDGGISNIEKRIEKFSQNDETLLVKDGFAQQEICDEKKIESKLTTVGTIMGTLSYMSPEQARGESVSTSSDIYSFGLILQELFSEKEAYCQVENFIEQLEIVRKGDTVKAKIEDRDLFELIERMKTYLPSQRPTAYDVYEKLKWISERPRRQLKRNLWISAFAFLIIILLIITYQTYRIKKEAERANHEAERANREALSSKKVSDFLISIFKVSDPYENKGESITARELLDRGSQRIEEELKSEPILYSRMTKTIGEVYMNLGLYAKARPHIQKSLKISKEVFGEESKEYAQSLESEGDLDAYLGDLEGAKKKYDESIKLKEKILGINSPELGMPLSNLGWVYYEKGELDKALTLLTRACNILNGLKDRENDYAYALNILAMTYKAKCDYEKAEETYLKTIDLIEKNSGAESMGLAQVMNNLAVMYKEKKEYEKARILYEKALIIEEKCLGSEHPDFAVMLNNLAAIEVAQKNFRKGEEHFKRAIAILEKHFPKGSLGSAYSYYNLGSLYEEEKRFKEAKELYLKAKVLFEKLLGKGNPKSRLCDERFKAMSKTEKNN